MASTKSPQPVSEPDGASTDIAKGMQQHGFCGDTIEIKLFKGETGEPIQPFFGLNNYQIQIQREKWVRVPVEMAKHIESLHYTVREPDPDEPENIDKAQWVEKARFPMQTRDFKPAARG